MIVRLSTLWLSRILLGVMVCSSLNVVLNNMSPCELVLYVDPTLQKVWYTMSNFGGLADTAVLISGMLIRCDFQVTEQVCGTMIIHRCLCASCYNALSCQQLSSYDMLHLA